MVSHSTEFPRSSGLDTDTDYTIDEEKGTGRTSPVSPPPGHSTDEGKGTDSAPPVSPSSGNVEDEENAQENLTPPDAPPPFVRAVSGWRWAFVCGAIYSAGFLYGLDNTIAADIQGAVVETYGEIDKLAWLGSGFPLGSIATILAL